MSMRSEMKDKFIDIPMDIFLHVKVADYVCSILCL